tara:strand:- start:156142 stop:157317 length:1176 start_codon:yes stop_codon:yes gene_type:complete
MRRTSLAWKNLTHQPARTAVSVGGIAFAILLMFMQLGFLGAVGDTATNVYRRMPCDLVLRSPEYLHVFDPRTIPDETLRWVGSLPEIGEVRPIDLTVAAWQNPETLEYRGVAVIGVDADRPALLLPELAEKLPLIRRKENVLMDRTSRSDFGPRDGKQFGPQDVGALTDVTGKEIRIAGTFEMGTGLAANGAMLINREGFQRIAPEDHSGRVSMVLVDLKPDVTVEAGAAAIRRRLAQIGGPASAIGVLTADEAVSAERRRWYVETPIGMIFAMGVVLAVIVGGVICYMVLAGDVLAHLPEYATLKAMGYSNGYLCRVLLSQAFWLASIALPPALVAALVLYVITSHLAGVPIQMTGFRVVLVAILSIVMCSSAGILALRKLAQVEPANLF